MILQQTACVVVTVIAGLWLLVVGGPAAIRPRFHVKTPCRNRTFCGHMVVDHGEFGCHRCLCHVAFGGVR